MTEDAPDRLSRWSRLKLAAATPEAAPVPAPEPEPEAPQIVEGEIPESELLEQLGLPDPDTLQAGDDFSAFMPKTVPDFLRRRALRRLWGSNPVLANVDGLVDYGQDFTDAAMVPEVLNTVYQVGRGMVSKVEKALDDLAEAEAAQPQADSAPAEAALGDPAAEAPAPAPEIEGPSAPAPGDPSGEIVDFAEAPSPPEPPQKPRRMRFDAG